MAKLLYSVTMSLDGFITGPDGDMSWLTPLIGPNPLVDDLITNIGALLVGNRTFRGDDPHKGEEGEGEPFGGGWSGPQFILTHSVPRTSRPDIIFMDDLQGAIAAARAAAGDKYVNILGASIARQCLEQGELDEILTIVAPLMLGEGTRLFEHPGGTNVKLERLSVAQAELATSLWFRVVK